MPSRNVSLKLQGLQEKDSGSYSCSVNVQNKGHDSKTVELSVLVPPATPSCSLLGVPRVGANVTLSCQSPRSDPSAQYQWERLPPLAQVFFAPVLGEGVSGNTQAVAGEGVEEWCCRTGAEGGRNAGKG
ncbi:PREDICTED: endothelial cell-selective adhesion molecule-like [Chinchilla lanigera]|uniref:endothelial cell-selective adhesion molecule-like n=1 Tax=Chinchilla lanigera TaxID=34839 RepID=UPI00069735E7|nr:PREDICTED: endothelial cell-selective adhesion molecule-like [Chinchilla lanigera]